MRHKSAQIERLQHLEDEEETNPKKWAKSIAQLIHQGHLDEMEAWVQRAIDQIDTTVDAFHKPVVKALLDSGHPERGEILVDDLKEKGSDKLIEKIRRETTRSLGRKVFPSDVPVTEWWEGPRLVPEEDLMYWIPAQVSKTQAGMVHLYVMQRDDDGTLDDRELIVRETEIDENSNIDLDNHKSLSYEFLEIGVYHPDSSMKFRFYD